jgi:hypothetical protein
MQELPPELIIRNLSAIQDVKDETRPLLEGDILPELERIEPQLFGFILDTLVKILQMRTFY